MKNKSIKVMCIDNMCKDNIINNYNKNKNLYLTKYKVYDVIEVYNEYYRILDDSGVSRDYFIFRFINYSEYLENLIKEILE